MKNLICLSLLMLISCKTDTTQYLNFVEGYWEIEQVKKEGKIIKTFKVNSGIDYFKINADRMGFRKKLKPNFQGTFETSEDVLNFKLKLGNNTILLEYTDNDTTYSEEIVSASTTALVLANTEGFEYHYKPYEPLNLDE
ncbi:MAG: hypothetical protein P8H23_06410 [Flavobacteriaceae bacterium]|nr:hypothetical protein [Flavobacteriaceae bacterium]